MSSTNPHKKDIEELEQLVQQYPYVALYRTLLTKKSKTEKRANFNDLLKQTAFYSPSRKRLYHYLNTEEKKKKTAKSAEKVKTTKLPKVEARADEKTKPAKTKVEAKNKPVENVSIESKHTKAVNEVEPKLVEKRISPIQEKQEKNKAEAVSLPKIEKEIVAKEEHSFVDWLNFLDGEEPIQTEEKAIEKPAENDELATQFEQHQAAIIYEADLNKAITEEEAKQERIELSEEDSRKVNRLAEGSITLKQSTVTETLAKIMLMQGKINDAIAMYEALSLKYPEKSNYFAAQIEKIKK